MIEDYVYYDIIWVLAFCGGIVIGRLVEKFYPALKKRRKNRRLQKLVVYGDTETHLLYIQKPLPDSPETLRERRRSLSQWLGSRVTDGCRHTKSETQVYFDIDYYKYTVVHKCLLCGETQESEINRDELYDL